VPSHPPATDRSALDCRSDVLVYETDPLSSPLTILGSPVLTLWLEADQPSFDLSATLSLWDPQAHVMPLTQGYSRYHQPSPPLTLTCHPIAAHIPAGSRLRLSLSASAFPAYSVNDGQGSALPDVMELPIVTLTCRSGISCPSQITMPLAPNQDKTIRRSG
jgi:predicted acyl esterase